MAEPVASSEEQSTGLITTKCCLPTSTCFGYRVEILYSVGIATEESTEI